MLKINIKNNVYSNYNQQHDNNINSLPNCTRINWQLTDHEILLTEEYYMLATVMMDDNRSLHSMPDINHQFTHFASDVVSAKPNAWLTGSIINTFLTCMQFNSTYGEQRNNVNVLNTFFYVLLTNTTDRHENQPEWNTYNYNAVREFKSHYTKEDLLKDTIIPIHIPQHWLLCIISLSTQKIYVFDSLRKNRINILQNIPKLR